MLTGKSMKWLSRRLFPVLALEKLISISRQQKVLPFYHAVSDEPLPHLRHVMKIRDTKTFRKDLDFLLNHFQPVDARQLLDDITGNRPLPGSCFHLTFDDGLKECVTIIAPILREKGIPATFFINTGFIGNRDIFFRYKTSLLIDRLTDLSPEQIKSFHEQLKSFSIPPGNLKNRLLAVKYDQKGVLENLAETTSLRFDEYASKQKVYMNAEDIAALQQSGFSIGSHAIDHPLFSTISGEERHRQVSESLEFLQEHFRISPVLFSFPFSDEGVPSEFFRQLYPPEGIVDLSFGISGLKADITPFHLHRIPMENGTDSARQIIGGEYLYYLLKSVLGRNKIYRK
jgi:peptidoglycan/xylan/chitin deacetylase (PgdA/CDA1 family)